jgi:hypothetical protein
LKAKWARILLSAGRRESTGFGQADIRETYWRSYRIVYRTDGQDPWVLTVFEGSRRLRSSDIDEG